MNNYFQKKYMYYPVLFKFVTDDLEEQYDSIDSDDSSSEAVRDLNFTVSLLFLLLVSGQLSTVQTCISPDEWCYWLAVVLVGSSPRDGCPDGQ